MSVISKRYTKTALKIMAFFLIFIILTIPVQASIINVPSDHSTIQAALDNAKNGDTVLVAQGTYPEFNIDFKGKEILLKSISNADSTIIDGDSSGPVFYIVSGETRDTIIDGFTIQNGYGNQSHLGGGIYIANSSPTIRNSIINNNRSELIDGCGGGIKVSTGSNPLIENNTITGNFCYRKGGGIQVYSASAEIRNNEISNNVVSGDVQSAGGGIGGTFTVALSISGNTIEANTAIFAGGGLSVFAGNADIIDNNIRNNDGGDFGGGIHIETQTAYGDFSYHIQGNYITNNIGLTGGGIVSFMEDTNSSVEINNNDIVGNEGVHPDCLSASDPDCARGGGLALFSGVGNHIVKDNNIQNNRADLYGGVLLIKMPAILEGNVFKDNRSRYNYGGVTLVDTANCVVSGNTFSGNFSESYNPTLRNSGGLYVKNSNSAIVKNNFFYNNSGYQASAAQFIGCSSPVKVFNNTFLYNHTVSGGGATIRTESETNFINNIFAGDIIGIRISGSPNVIVNNNSFHDQSNGLITTTSGNITTVFSLNNESYASDNISSDPMFVDDNDFHLTKGSPCIDTGASNEAPDTDIDGDARPHGQGYDIGADEFISIPNLMPLLQLLLLKN